MRRVRQDNEIVEKQGHKTLVIGNGFGFLKMDKQPIDICCKLCKWSVATKTGSTTNLSHNLKRHHQ